MKGLRHGFSLSFKIFAAVLLLLSVGSASSVASAHHVRSHRTLIHRRIYRRHGCRVRRHYHLRTGSIRLRKIRRHIKRNRYPSQNQINRNCYELRQRTLLNINRDRRRHRLPQLKTDRRLFRIGAQRSYQLQRYFSHNTPDHNVELAYLLNRKHVNYNYYGENIASSPLGKINVIAVGRYDNPYDAKKNQLVYRARNGYQLANNIEDASMNHDSGDQNGHRDNILDKHFKRIGVGSSYNFRDHSYYLSIEFIS